MNSFDFIAQAGLTEVLSVSQITTTERITRTIKGGKTTITIRNFLKRALTLRPSLSLLLIHFHTPLTTPSPSRSVELSGWPPCSNVIPSTFSIFTVLKQQIVYFEMRTYVAGSSYRRDRPKEETQTEIFEGFIIHYLQRFFSS